MRALCEKIIPSVGCSWRYCLYELKSIPFHWHYHPEYEICLTLNAKGKCQVGDYIGEFGDLDLVILGPNLPHTWQSKPNENGQSQFVHVAQIPVRWVDEQILNSEEGQSLSKLFQQSYYGVRFSKQTAFNTKQIFDEMELSSPFERLFKLFQILNLMATDKAQTLLATVDNEQCNNNDFNKDKFDKVVNYIYDNFTEELNATKLANIAHMSTNHFHRYFKRRMERTVNDFVNELRIAKACNLLISSNMPIAVISDQCGYNNISNFNRRFQAYKECTPSAFRSRFRSKAMV